LKKYGPTTTIAGSRASGRHHSLPYLLAIYLTR
jgi:hypothetical protein